MEEYDSSQSNVVNKDFVFCFFLILGFVLLLFGLGSTMKYLAKALRRQCNRIHLCLSLKLHFSKSHFLIVSLVVFTFFLVWELVT